MYCFIQCHCHYKEGTSQKFCFPDKAFIIILSFITARHILCCSCSIISQNRKQNMYWLSGRAEQENIWLKIRMYGSRAKYFPVQSYLTQSIRISSYDWTLVFFLTERTGIDQFAFLAGLRFSSPIANDMYCTQKDFFICFSYEIAHGAIQVIL